MRSDSLLGRIVVNTALLIAGKGANAVFTLAYLALAVRALGVEGLGILVLIHTYAQAVGDIVRLRSWEAALRYGAPALQQEQIGRFQALIKFTGLLDIASSIVGAATAILGCAIVASLLGWPPELLPLTMLYCVTVLVVAPATATGLLRLFDRFDLLAIHSAIGSSIRLIGAAGLLAMGGGIGAFLALWFVATLVATVALVGFAWRETTRRRLLSGMDLALRPAAAPFAGIWRFVWATNLNAAVATISTQVPTLLVGGLLGAAEAALFRIARELADALAKPAKLLIPVIFPELARLAANGAIRPMQQLVRRSLALSGAAALAGMLAFWLAGDLLLRVVIGEGGAPATSLLLLLGIAALLTLWAFPLEPLLISVGRETAALRARLAATLVYVPLSAALISAIGLIGAGIAAIVAAVVMVAGQLVASWRWFAQGVSKSGQSSDTGRQHAERLAPAEGGH